MTGGSSENDALALVNERQRGADVLANGDCSATHNRVIYLGGHFGVLLLAQDCGKHIVAARLQCKLRTAILIARDFALITGVPLLVISHLSST